MRRYIIILGLILLILVLHSAFPYVLQDTDARMRVLYLVLLLSLGFAGGSRAFKGRPIPKALRDAGIWLVIMALLVCAYSFKGELAHSRFMAELMPSEPQLNSDGSLSVRASEGGHFYIEGEVNGARVRFLVDTGASNIVLTPDDAKRAGLEPEALDYSGFYATANGTGRGATVTLASLKVGSIMLQRVPASVNKTWMHESLLGMSFLNRLKGFNVQGNMLILIP